MNSVCRLYGKGELRIESEEVAQPGPNEVHVDVKRGGICGSDLHYYKDGGIGTIRVSDPIILGHEISGTIRKTGSGVTAVAVGDRVAINPSKPCMRCSCCDQGIFQHCANMQFMGSAKTRPHVQGGFRDSIVVEATQCHRVEDHTGYGEAACSEPLAVCLHAVNQVDDLFDQRILVTGAGPIGSLCTAVAAHRGAREIVVTDLTDFTLDIASQMGATHVINVASQPQMLYENVLHQGDFDIVFECSAAAPAIKTAIEFVKSRGTVVQVGTSGETLLPLNVLVGKEITFKGSMRFHEEFADAVALINDGKINVTPLITQTYPLAEARAAFKVATDRSSAMKVQLEFGQ